MNNLQTYIKKYYVLSCNVFSLFAIRGSEYLFGMLYFPYLVRVLGPERYGMIVFVQGIMQYFILITDYGFNITGIKEIACAGSNEKEKKIFSGIMGAKLCIFLCCTIFFLNLIYFIPLLWEEKYIYFGTYLGVLGNVIFPSWFFHGIQKMKYITFANLAARFFSTAGIFFFVKNPEDYILAAVFQSSVPVLSGIFSFCILIRNYKYLLIIPDVEEIRKQLIEGWRMFISTIAINLYTGSNMVFLGLLTNSATVGYFSGAKKIIDCICGLLVPITQSLYPYISSIAKKSPLEACCFITKCATILCGGNFLGGILLFLFADDIVSVFLGKSYGEAVSIIRILSFVPFFISLSNVLGVQTMLTFGWIHLFNRTVIYSAILNICIIFPLVYSFSANGVAIATFVTEAFTAFMCWYLLQKKGFEIFISQKGKIV